MFKRLDIYLKEMFPLVPRLLLGFVLFFEIYFLVILTNDVPKINVSYEEFIGGYTIFVFLLNLRIADEFKDREVDLKLFSHRPYPSGRVYTKDLAFLMITTLLSSVILNFLFLDNFIYFVILILYGTMMSLWFFNKHKIQKSLVLALITHNPVQIFMNLYIISFACIKYDLQIFTFVNFVIALTLYFPGLIWEVSRKIKAPKDETEYVTYSKLFGYKKATRFIMIVMFFDMITTSFLVYKLFKISIITVVVAYIWLVYQCKAFIKNPEKFKLVDKVEMYEYVAEIMVVVIEVFYIVRRVL